MRHVEWREGEELVKGLDRPEFLGFRRKYTEEKNYGMAKEETGAFEEEWGGFGKRKRESIRTPFSRTCPLPHSSLNLQPIIRPRKKQFRT